MSSKFYKQVGVIKDLEGNILFTCDIVECLSEEEYKSLHDTAKENYSKLKEEEKEKLEYMKKEFFSFKANTNDKLKQYHDILQTLVKENE